MSLTVAVQMDPLEDININGDSTFVMMLEAQKRGYSLVHYQPQDLSWQNGKVTARVRPFELRRELGNHFTAGEPQAMDLATADVVLMRQDPPFDMAYITATHLLELIHPKTLVVNDPASVRNAPEKLLVTHFPDMMPSTLISRDEAAIKDFRREHGDIIVKPLFGNGGVGVFHLRPEDSNLNSLLEMFFESSRDPVMVQEFIPQVVEGDKRIILIDGEVAGAINRVPAKGEIRSNMVVGGRAEKSVLTPREEEICERLKPVMKEQGLIFVGLDVIADKLTEINVTSPTGLQAVNAYDDVCLEAQIWDAIESRLS